MESVKLMMKYRLRLFCTVTSNSSCCFQLSTADDFVTGLSEAYSVTTPTKATQPNVPQTYQIKIAEVNNSFPTN